MTWPRTTKSLAVYWCLGVATVVFLGLGLDVTEGQTLSPPPKSMPSDIPEAERTALGELESTFVNESQTSTASVVDRKVVLFDVGHLRFLESSYPSVRHRYCELLLSHLTALDDIPVVAAQQIDAVLAQSSSTESGDADLMRLKRRIRWYLRLRVIPDAAARVRVLIQHLDDLSDGYYFAFTSMDELVRLGSDDARTALQSVTERGTRQSVDSGLLQKAKTSIEEIDISEVLKNASPMTQVAILQSAILAPLSMGGVIELQFRLRLIKRLDQSGADGLGALRRIGEATDLPPQMQRAAAEALDRRRGR